MGALRRRTPAGARARAGRRRGAGTRLSREMGGRALPRRRGPRPAGTRGGAAAHAGDRAGRGRRRVARARRTAGGQGRPGPEVVSRTAAGDHGRRRPGLPGAVPSPGRRARLRPRPAGGRRGLGAHDAAARGSPEGRAALVPRRPRRREPARDQRPPLRGPRLRHALGRRPDDRPRTRLAAARPRGSLDVPRPARGRRRHLAPGPRLGTRAGGHGAALLLGDHASALPGRRCIWPARPCWTPSRHRTSERALSRRRPTRRQLPLRQTRSEKTRTRTSAPPSAQR